jgi:plastocyanin
MKLFLTLSLLVAMITGANATIHTVTCQNSPSHYLPVTINVMVGDTIHWVWVAGVHVVGPIRASDIPAGAAMFNAPIDNTHLTFDYVVTVAGNYHYVCHPATPHGEDGYIVASLATGIQSYSPLNNLSSVYPNPFSSKITIETSRADLISIYNILGEQVQSYVVESGQTKLEIDLATLPTGVFFYSIRKDGAVLETRKIIKN